MNGRENSSLLIGRLLMSAIFIHGGWGKMLAFAATQATFDKLGLPVPMVAWLIAVIVELGGGLLLLVGLFTRPVGIVLAAWCVATALIAHRNLAERAQEIQFFKNMAMTGGFLYVFAVGAGAYSLDGLLGRGRAAPVHG